MADDEIILNEQLYNHLKIYAESIKLTAPKFHITRGSNKGDNYVGLVYCIKVEGVESGNAKIIHLILKAVPTNGPDRDLMQSRKMFQREIFFYREVLPTFKAALKDRGGIINRFPTMYSANDESGKEVLLLENLTCEGFVMKDSRILDEPHLSLALRCLGEFHAYSFAMRVICPKSFDKLRHMEEPLFPKSLLQTDHSSSYHKDLCNIIEKALIDEDKHYSERFRKFSENLIKSMIDATDGSLAEPYAVVNHGDAWTNNILFKYDQKLQQLSREKIPYDLRFLDFQLCRYASPALDLVYILFCCCTQETRKKYYDQLLHKYYETLSKRLESFGCDPNVLFPYEVLTQHLTTFGKFAAGMSIYVLHLFTDVDDKTGEIASRLDKNYLEKRLQTDSFYRQMLKGTFKDLVDKNYI